MMMASVHDDFAGCAADGVLTGCAAEILVRHIVLRPSGEDVLAASNHPVEDLLAAQLPGVAVGNVVEISARSLPVIR